MILDSVTSRFIPTVFLTLAVSVFSAPARADLKLNDRGYFEAPGLNVIVFSDIYPEGHQTGVTIIQHGVRVAANGDLRLEASPGQWSPVPVSGERVSSRRWAPYGCSRR